MGPRLSTIGWTGGDATTRPRAAWSLLEDDERVDVDAAAGHDELDPMRPRRRERRRVCEHARLRGRARQGQRGLEDVIEIDLDLAAGRGLVRDEADGSAGEEERRRAARGRRVADRATGVDAARARVPRAAVRHAVGLVVDVGGQPRAAGWR